MNLDLEKRNCLCGCGLSFRVMATSMQRYASNDHEELDADRPLRDPVNPGGRALISLPQLARVLRISYQTLYLWARSEKIPHVRTGFRKSYDIDAVRVAMRGIKRRRRKKKRPEARR